MKFIHQLLIHVRGQSISCSKNFQQHQKEIQKHIEQLKKLMRQCLKENFNRCI